MADKKAFGTERNVYAAGYTWMMHSVAPHPAPADPVAALRVTVGGPECRQPYSTRRGAVVERSRAELGDV